MGFYEDPMAYEQAAGMRNLQGNAAQANAMGYQMMQAKKARDTQIMLAQMDAQLKQHEMDQQAYNASQDRLAGSQRFDAELGMRRNAAAEDTRRYDLGRGDSVTRDSRNFDYQRGRDTVGDQRYAQAYGDQRGDVAFNQNRLTSRDAIGDQRQSALDAQNAQTHGLQMEAGRFDLDQKELSPDVLTNQMLYKALKFGGGPGGAPAGSPAAGGLNLTPSRGSALSDGDGPDRESPAENMWETAPSGPTAQSTTPNMWTSGQPSLSSLPGADVADAGSGLGASVSAEDMKKFNTVNSLTPDSAPKSALTPGQPAPVPTDMATLLLRKKMGLPSPEDAAHNRTMQGLQEKLLTDQVNGVVPPAQQRSMLMGHTAQAQQEFNDEMQKNPFQDPVQLKNKITSRHKQQLSISGVTLPDQFPELSDVDIDPGMERQAMQRMAVQQGMGNPQELEDKVLNEFMANDPSNRGMFGVSTPWAPDKITHQFADSRNVTPAYLDQNKGQLNGEMLKRGIDQRAAAKFLQDIYSRVRSRPR